MILLKIPLTKLNWSIDNGNQSDQKKSPNVYQSCPKMISLAKWKILTPLQKLPKNEWDFGKLIVATGFEKLPKDQKIGQSGHTDWQWQWPRFIFHLREKIFNNLDITSSSKIKQSFRQKNQKYMSVPLRQCVTLDSLPTYPVWPDVGIKSRPILTKVAQNVCTVVSLNKWSLSK